MSDFLKLSDNALIAELNRLGDLVSHYEAAEGQSYAREARERIAAKAAFYTALAIARERNLEIPSGFML
jgi:hypothetical protein